ncbi:MAG: hypothetical protein JW864_16555 [Spirochaetes bacterium]|nr:hypothetical protein [Spirochaetota bacterium]
MKKFNRFICICISLTLLLVFTACSDDGESSSSPVKSWRTPEPVESYNGGTATSPKVAADGSGNIIAVWKQRNFAGITDILSNRYVPGTGWGASELIESDDTGDAGSPVISINNDGKAAAAWLQYDTTYDNVWVNRYSPESGWETAELIEAEDDGYAYKPSVAIDNSGNTVVVWRHHDNSTTRDNVLSSFCHYGDSWQPQFIEAIESTIYNGFDPVVAFDNEGNAVAVWKQWDSTYSNIYANRYVSGFGWGGQVEIDSDTETAGSPQVAVNKDGIAVAIWLQGNNVWGNYYEPGTGWQTAGLLETDAGGTLSPHVAIDSDGNAIAVWEQSISGYYSIYSNRYVPGTGWGTAERIDNIDNIATTSQVSGNEDGIAVAVWSQLEGSVYHIWANRYVPGAGWGTAVRIQTDDNSGINPSVAVDNEGNAIVVWEQESGTRYDIWSCRYE